MHSLKISMGALGLWLAAEGLAAGFEAPLPPPELGDQLTGYRTRQQMMEQSARDEARRHPPKMRIYRKDGTKEVYTDSDSLMEYGGRFKKAVPAAAGPAPAKAADAGPRLTYAPSGKRIVTERDVYGPGKSFRIHPEAALVLRVRDGSEFAFPVVRAESSNGGFRLQLNRSQDSVRVLPTSDKTNMATVRVFLLGRENDPLTFVVTKDAGAAPDILERFVSVPWKSPLNDTGAVKGITDLRKSARARAAWREDPGAAAKPGAVKPAAKPGTAEPGAAR